MINLGSSARVAEGWNNVDFSWLVRLSKHKWLARYLHKIQLLSDFRYKRIQRMDPHAILWNLKKGIPFPDRTFDVVYHSHVLEHIDRDLAPEFLRECYRVLKPGGVQRIVVPDLEQLARSYLSIIDRMPGAAAIADLNLAVEEIFDQMVRRIPRYRTKANIVVYALETLLIGDSARSGVLHRWMYDRFSLENLLCDIGFADVKQHTNATSGVEAWASFNLDTEPDGSPYKPGSLYMECSRP